MVTSTLLHSLTFLDPKRQELCLETGLKYHEGTDCIHLTLLGW